MPSKYVPNLRRFLPFRVYPRTFGIELIINRPDWFAVSYPKSGRTWINLLLSKYFANITGFETKDTNLLLDFPRLGALLPSQLPSLTFTHGSPNPLIENPDQLKSTHPSFDNKHVILFLRDPRDVLISSYFERTKRNSFSARTHWPEFSGTIMDFIEQPYGGLETVLAFFRHWEAQRHRTREHHIFYYEDFINNTSVELARLVAALKAPVVKRHILNAIDFAEFENMRRLESSLSTNSEKLRPGDKSDPDSFKTRRGKVGGYLKYLTKEQIVQLNARLSECQELSLLGYPNETR